MNGGTTVTGAEIREHDVRTAPDDVLAALHDVYASYEVESRSDVPPTPLSLQVAEWRDAPRFREERTWAAWAGDRVVGVSGTEIERTGDNEHLIWTWVVVRAEHRGQGLTRALLRPVVDHAAGEGRHTVMGASWAHLPVGEGFARRLGAEQGLVERESELVVADLDRALMRRWIGQGPVRAPDYELVWAEDRIPPELEEPFCRLFDVTNTAPRDALDMGDEHLTVERLREYQDARQRRGAQEITCMARHAPSGELAGFTDVFWHPDRPWKVDQGWTAVHPDHRGRALGKWLKAAMVERLLERWPSAERIVTGNAYSNDAMIGINDEMGFRETRAEVVWQLPLDRLRAFVDS